MANVMEILGRIKTAIYGRDVRQSIYDAILQCYKDATGNPESIAAHTGDIDNPHNVTAEQVGLANAAEDISQAQKDISGLKNPEFEDFTAEGSTPPDARTAIAAITSKMSFFTYLSKVKAALMGLVTLGEMRSLLINNGLTTEAGKYFLDAAYGKTLADLVASNASAISQLNSYFNKRIYIIKTGGNKTFDIGQSYGWIFMHNMGSDGISGNAEIFNYRFSNDSSKVIVVKLTNNSDITCTATISNGIIHFAFNCLYVVAIILTVESPFN